MTLCPLHFVNYSIRKNSNVYYLKFEPNSKMLFVTSLIKTHIVFAWYTREQKKQQDALNALKEKTDAMARKAEQKTIHQVSVYVNCLIWLCNTFRWQVAIVTVWDTQQVNVYCNRCLLWLCDTSKLVWASSQTKHVSCLFAEGSHRVAELNEDKQLPWLVCLDAQATARWQVSAVTGNTSNGRVLQ